MGVAGAGVGVVDEEASSARTRHLAANPRQAAMAIAIVIVAAAGYVWYATRPQPALRHLHGAQSALTTYDERVWPGSMR